MRKLAAWGAVTSRIYSVLMIEFGVGCDGNAFDGRIQFLKSWTEFHAWREERRRVERKQVEVSGQNLVST